MNVASIDLNLLKAFHAMIEARNVTRAGALIGLAQPSMSNALGRLRHLFGDELFVRTPRGMLPTERALELAPKIASVLQLVQDAIAQPAAFDPKTAKEKVSIAAGDSVQMMLGPKLAAHFCTAAPHFDLRLRPLDKDLAFTDLDESRLDMLVGSFAEIPARFFQHDLFKDHFVCIARDGHPLLKRTLSKQQFADIPQVLMTLRADARGVIDETLKQHGLKRRIALTVGQFIAIPDIVATTDYIAAIPASLARDVAERAGCKIHPMPITVAPWTMSLVWSQSANVNAAKRFVIDEIGHLNSNAWIKEASVTSA